MTSRNEGNHGIAEIRAIIRDIHDFPKPGIVFKDITPLLSNGPLFRKTIDLFAERYESAPVDTVVGVESRGFIIGAALAYRLGKGLCVVRKPGKLPYDTLKATYELEYGTDTLEVHSDALAPRRPCAAGGRPRRHRRNRGRRGRTCGATRRHGLRARLHHRARLSQAPEKARPRAVLTHPIRFGVGGDIPGIVIDTERQ